MTGLPARTLEPATPTTTIRIEDAFKERVAAAAQAGKTSHAFILDAIAQSVEQAEFDAEMAQVAGDRWSRLQASGETVGWDKARAWLLDRAHGRPTMRPAARRVKPGPGAARSGPHRSQREQGYRRA